MIPIITELGTSITLCSVRTDKFKTGMLSFSVAMPRRKKSSPYNLLLSGVMRRGTQKYPGTAQLNRRLDDLYAATVEIKNQRLGENEIFTISSELLDDAYCSDSTDIFGGVAELMGELLFCPLTGDDGSCTEKNVALEKKTAADSLRAEINNPRGYAMLRCSEIMERDNPELLTLDGMIREVESADRHSISAYYRDNIITRPIEVFYVGGLDRDTVADKLARVFGDLSASRRDTAVPLSSVSADGNLRNVCEEMPVSQGKLVIGARSGVCADSPDFCATLVANEILGGSPSSKLFMNVREKLGLCYYCSSSYNMYTGNIMIGSGIEVSDRERVQSAVFSELDDLKSGRISETEFQTAKKTLENQYRQIYDNPFELQGFYSGRRLFGIDCTVDECRRNISDVTKEQVISAARKIQPDTVFFLKGSVPHNGEDCDDD